MRTGVTVCGLVCTLVFAQCPAAWATTYTSKGSVSRFYGSDYGAQAGEMKWSFLGAGQDTAAVWAGVAVTVANAVWPEFNGEWYLRGGAAAESWELWTAAVGGSQATATHTGVSDSFGIPAAYLIPGHPGFVQGIDTVDTGKDPRITLLGPPSHMWAPGSTNGSQSPGITTMEIKLPGLTQYTGQQMELVECFWSELNNKPYYFQYLRNDGNATRHLLWMDAALSVPVLPSDMDAVGDYVTSLGGNGAGLWTGYLSSARDGRFVAFTASASPIPEPATAGLAVMALAGLGAALARRRGRA